MKNYTQEAVVASLKLKHDVHVWPLSNIVQLLYGAHAIGDYGIHSKGKVDFLKKLGFHVEWVKDFENPEERILSNAKQKPWSHSRKHRHD